MSVSFIPDLCEKIQFSSTVTLLPGMREGFLVSCLCFVKTRTAYKSRQVWAGEELGKREQLQPTPSWQSGSDILSPFLGEK